MKEKVCAMEYLTPKKIFEKKISDFFLLKAIFCSGLRKSSNQTGNQSCLILIELDVLNSELFTKCKNSKYFSRFCVKPICNSYIFDPLLGLKMVISGGILLL